MLLLVGKSGRVRGRAWPLDREPLVIGRDPNCEVPIDDPMVSRRHCMVGLQGGSLKASDLGSSNATFVNGDPIKEVELDPGDEIAIGGAIFMVSETRPDEEAQPISSELPATYDLQMGEPLYLFEEGEKLLAQSRPRTAGDLAFLFHLSRKLTQAETVVQVAETLLELVNERFHAKRVAIILKETSGGELRWIPIAARDGFKGPPLAALITHALDETQGALLPERVGEPNSIRTTLVAPMVVGGTCIGAISTQTMTPDAMYEQSDLEFLLCVAHVAAAYIAASEHRESLELENERLVVQLPQGAAILGESNEILKARELARQAARSDLSVLILGETGAGKELLSRMVHELSARREKQLVIVNCAAIPDELFESEVFGHERGAFTGAHAQRVGLLEEANGGTLFLDEVGDLSPQNQARILRAIDAGTFRRLGGKADVKVNVRYISATNKDLAEEVEAGRFRRDLYHRLNPFEIRIPPLRQRKDDIPALARHFLALARQRFEGPARDFSSDSVSALKNYPWPGNIRQLRNVVERAAVVAQGALVQQDELNLLPAPVAIAGDEPFLTLAEIEKRHIAEALRKFPDNMKQAAEALGIGRSTLYRKLQEYGLG